MRSWRNWKPWSKASQLPFPRAFEVGCTLNWMRYTAGLTTKIAGKTLDLSIPLPQGARYQAWTRKEPVGVVAGIVAMELSVD